MSGCRRWARRNRAFAHPTQSIDTPSQSRGWIRPSFARNSFTLQSEGAGKAGCALHPRSRVQQARVKKRTRAYRFSGSIRLSLRNGLRLIRALLGEPCAFATVARAALSCELDTSPWDVGTTRFRRPHQAPWSEAPSASTASPSRIGDLGQRPLLMGRDGY
jgi:hypothetical protein